MQDTIISNFKQIITVNYKSSFLRGQGRSRYGILVPERQARTISNNVFVVIYKQEKRTQDLIQTTL